MKKNRPNLLLRSVVCAIIFFLFAYCGVMYLMRALERPEYFKIRDIIPNEKDELFDFSYLKGRSILTLDLAKEERRLLDSYHSYKKVKLIRVLPGRLFINFTKRSPIAFIKLYRYFCVDEDLILFDAPKEADMGELPVILGLEKKIIGPKTGKAYNINGLAQALNIIKEAQRDEVLRDYRIKIIDVANASEASFFISGGLEIRIGQDNLKDKIHILGSLFRQLKEDLGDIKYIDLRFQEPVVKFRDV